MQVLDLEKESVHISAASAWARIVQARLGGYGRLRELPGGGADVPYGPDKVVKRVSHGLLVANGFRLSDWTSFNFNDSV